MIRHVIFDLDGTLVDSCATCVGILTDMLHERGSDHVIDPVVARTFMSRGGLDMVAGLLGPACTDPAADLQHFRARYQAWRTSADTLYPGIARGLRQLKDAGLILSICSNKPQGLCENVVADTALAQYFSVVVGGRAGLRPKPSSDLLDLALLELGARAQDCVFVGDSELDHAVADKAGMPFYFLSHGYAEPGWAPPTGMIADHFDKVVEAIVPIHVYA